MSQGQEEIISTVHVKEGLVQFLALPTEKKIIISVMLVSAQKIISYLIIASPGSFYRLSVLVSTHLLQEGAFFLSPF